MPVNGGGNLVGGDDDSIIGLVLYIVGGVILVCLIVGAAIGISRIPGKPSKK